MCTIGVIFSVDVFYARKNKKLRKEKVGMRGLPSALLYMITVIYKAKICTAFFTANQSTKTNLKN